jgi:hypothetical protein
LTEGVDFQVIRYENFVYRKTGRGDATVKELNELCPVASSTFMLPKTDANGNIIDASRGVLPRTLMRLLDARKATKRKMAASNDPFQVMLLDALQSSFKVVANSLYGQCGASTSPIQCRPIAASCTATGRKTLLFARDHILASYPGSRAVYGDSVSGDTPLLLRHGGMLYCRSIANIVEYWGPYDGFKPGEPDRSDKQQASIACDVWTDSGWCPTLRLVRHRTRKRMFRVSCATGVVDVTEDHSLLVRDSPILISP